MNVGSVKRAADKALNERDLKNISTNWCLLFHGEDRLEYHQLHQLLILFCASGYRYPRACHLICLRVAVDKDKPSATGATPSPDAERNFGEALTPSKGQGRAMHGQILVDWLEVWDPLYCTISDGALHYCVCILYSIVNHILLMFNTNSIKR